MLPSPVPLPPLAGRERDRALHYISRETREDAVSIPDGIKQLFYLHYMNAEHPDLPEKNEKLARRIAYLFHAYIIKTISDAENNELDEWVCASMKNQKLFEEFTDPVFIEKSMESIQMIKDFLNPN
jgi:hypothetical protein